MTKKHLNKKNNLGFTLVELIVVIVILAILAAILLPMLLGYIDEAKEKQKVVTAKALMNSIQTELSKCYAKFNPNGDVDSNQIFGEKTKPFNNSTDDPNLTTSEFTNRVFRNAGIQDNPKLVLFYTLNYDFKNPKIGQTVHDAFTVISIVYWSHDSEKPIFFNIDSNSWEEGNFYTAEFMLRGSGDLRKKLLKKYSLKDDNKNKNIILSGHKYEGKGVRIYVLYNDTDINDIVQINNIMETAMGIKYD